MKDNLDKPLWIYAMKGVATAAMALLVKGMLALFTWLYYSNISILKEYDNYIVNIVLFVASLILYNSIIGVLGTFDVPSAFEYLERKDSGMGKLRALYCAPSFITEYISATLVLSISAVLGAFGEIGGMFYFEEGLSPYRAGFLPFGATLLIFTMLYALRRYEAMRYWCYLEKVGRLEEISSKTKIISRLLFIFFLYPTVLPFFPLLLLGPVSLFSVFVMVAEEVTVFGLIGIIAGIIFVIWGLKLLICLKKRKSFIKRLITTSNECGYELSNLKNPYLSLVNRAYKCSFDLRFKNVKFNCLIIGGKNKRVPVCFSSATEGCFRYRLGTKMHHITLSLKFDYSLSGDGIKLLILDPTPNRAMICEIEKEKILFNADKLWDFVVYEADAFIGAEERYCLGKYDLNRI